MIHPRNMNQHSPWQTDPPATKLNTKQWTVIWHRQQRGQVECWKCTGERGIGKELISMPNYQEKNTGKAVKTESRQVEHNLPERKWSGQKNKLPVWKSQ
jgi:hypothetical protein